MAISLQGKAAIVTGAGRGIGRGIAHVFAREGANVLVVNRGADAGQTVVEEITGAGGKAVLFQGNVKSKADMEGMAAACLDNFGAIDILCLNAGIFPASLLGDLSEEMWDDVLDTNLKSLFLGTQACIPQMKKQMSGRIVVTSSITGPNVGWPGLCHYMASKGGANAFIRGAALELAKYNITVNGVSPGSIMTEGLQELGGDGLEAIRQIIPAGYIGEPEDIAYALLYLACEQARYVTGQILIVDGGQILPESPAAMADA
jgi:3-oxoacyl-[acyl-carrier protein] reductase